MTSLEPLRLLRPAKEALDALLARRDLLAEELRLAEEQIEPAKRSFREALIRNAPWERAGHNRVRAPLSGEDWRLWWAYPPTLSQLQWQGIDEGKGTHWLYLTPSYPRDRIIDLLRTQYGVIVGGPFASTLLE